MRLQHLRHHRRSILRVLLLMMLAMAITVFSLGGCTAADRAADVEPVHEKLVTTAQALPAGGASAMALSRSGRLFIARPEQSGAREVLLDGEARPYPGASWSDWDGRPGPGALRALVSPTALWVDRDEHLWALDAGRDAEAGLVSGGPKLVQTDLAGDRVVHVTFFDVQRELTSASRLTDVRADGAQRVAYVLDSGRGVVLVVDQARRAIRPVTVPGASALALSPDAAWLYVVGGRDGRLCRIPTQALRDPDATAAQLEDALEPLGALGTPISAMAIDNVLDLYLAAPDRRAILRRRAVGDVSVLVADGQMGRPGALVLGPGRYLHFLAEAPAQRVLKISLDRAGQAVAARHDLEAAQRWIAEGASALQQAEALATRKREAADAAHREAMTLSAAAAQAQQAADAAVDRKIKAISVAVEQARWQAIVKGGRAPATEQNAGALTEQARQQANALADLARLATERAATAAEKARQAQAWAQTLESDARAAATSLAALRRSTELAAAEATRASATLRSTEFAELQSHVAEHMQTAVDVSRTR